MPIYEFSCDDCKKEFEEILPSADISDVTCSACGSSNIKKVISSGSIRVGASAGLGGAIPPAPACGKSGFS